jgi:hypothetical protein
LKHLSRLFVFFGLTSLVSTAIYAQAQAVVAGQIPMPDSASLPNAPVAQFEPQATTLRSPPDFWSSSALEPAVDGQDPQTTQDSQKPADTLKKPIHQNPVPTRHPQTKRILGLIPNFRSVSTDEVLPPMTVKEKFLTATDDSFDYSSIFIPAALAGFSMARKSTPEFGQGAVGYGRYLWHAAVDQTSENYMVEFIFPAVTHEDNRYYTQGRLPQAHKLCAQPRCDHAIRLRARHFQHQRSGGRRRFLWSVQPLLSLARAQLQQCGQ